MDNHNEDMPANKIENGSASRGINFEVESAELNHFKETNQRIIKDIVGRTIDFSTDYAAKRGNANIEISDLEADIYATSQVFESFSGQVVGVFPNVNTGVASGLSKSERIEAKGSADRLAGDVIEKVFLQQIIPMSGKDGNKINWRDSGYVNVREAKKRLGELEDRIERSSFSIANPNKAEKSKTDSARKKSPLPTIFPEVRTEISQTINQAHEDIRMAVESVADFVSKIPKPVRVLGAASIALAGCTPSSGGGVISTEVSNEIPSEVVETLVDLPENPDTQEPGPTATFNPETLVVTPEAPEASSFVPAVNPPEYSASGGSFRTGGEAVAENNYYVAINGLYAQEGGSAFETEQEFRNGMQSFLENNQLSVMQSESPSGNQILSLIISEDATSYYAYVTPEGAFRTSRLDIGDDESSLNRFDLPEGYSLGMSWRQEGGTENAYFYAVSLETGEAIAWLNTGESTTDTQDWTIVDGQGRYEIVDGQLIEVEPALGQFGFLAMNQSQLEWFQDNQELLRLPPVRYPLLLNGEQMPYGADGPFAELKGENYMMMNGVITRLLFPPIGETHPFNAGGFGVMVPEEGQDLEFGGEVINLAIGESAEDSGIVSVNIIDGTWITNEAGELDYEGESTNYHISFNNFTAFIREHIQNGNLEGSDILFTLRFVHGLSETDINFGLLLDSLTDGSPGEQGVFPSDDSRDVLPVFSLFFPTEVFEAHPDMLTDLQALSNN